MNHAASRVILASTSAYRRTLLSRILEQFDCLAPDTDETPRAGERPEALAVRLALAKARSVSRDAPEAVIIGSDQVASVNDRILHKPGDHGRAVEQLTACAGQTVMFYTAVAILGPADSPAAEFVDITRVRFRTLTHAEIDGYLRRDEPYDCAGSFKVESLGISLFESVDSTDPTGLQGLPLIRVAAALRDRNIELY